MSTVWERPTETNRFVDATAETEVELRLPLEVDMEPDRICEDVPIYPGAVDLDAGDPTPIWTPKRGQTEVAQTWIAVTSHSGTL